MDWINHWELQTRVWAGAPFPSRWNPYPGTPPTRLGCWETRSTLPSKSLLRHAGRSIILLPWSCMGSLLRSPPSSKQGVLFPLSGTIKETNKFFHNNLYFAFIQMVSCTQTYIDLLSSIHYHCVKLVIYI